MQMPHPFAGAGKAEPIPHSLNLVIHCADPHNPQVAQIHDLLPHEAELLWVQVQSSPCHSSQHTMERLQCRLERFTMNQEVIQLNNALLVGNVDQHFIHQPLKCGRGIAEAKRQDFKLP